VARQMGKVCVCGAADLQIDYAAKTVTVQGQTFKEGDYLSINGTVGEVYPGQIKTAASEIVQVLVEKSLKGKDSKTFGMYNQLMTWCDKATRMHVRTNADTPEQTENAIAELQRLGYRPYLVAEDWEDELKRSLYGDDWFRSSVARVLLSRTAEALSLWPSIRTRARRNTLGDGRYADVVGFPDLASRAREDATFEPTDPGPTPHDTVENLDRLRVLGTIPERERIALIRTVVDGDTAADVAKDLGVTADRVYTLVHNGSIRARRRAA